MTLQASWVASPFFNSCDGSNLSTNVAGSAEGRKLLKKHEEEERTYKDDSTKMSRKPRKPFTNKFALHSTLPATLLTWQVYVPESEVFTA